MLVFNSGSSSIKFAVYGPGEVPLRQLHGHLDRIGLSGTQLTFSEAAAVGHTTYPAAAADPAAAASFLLDWLAGTRSLLAWGPWATGWCTGAQHTWPPNLLRRPSWLTCNS